MNCMLKRLLPFVVLFIVHSTEAQKKHLTPEDYGKWQSLGAIDLSPNGEWLAYQISVQEDNDTMFIVNRNTNKVYKLEFASGPEFSKDNQWIAYRVGLPYKEAEKLREQSKPIEAKMGLLNLTTGKKEVVQNINRFGFSRDGKFLAVYLSPPKENKDKGAVLLVKNLSTAPPAPSGMLPNTLSTKRVITSHTSLNRPTAQVTLPSCFISRIIL